MFNVPFITTRLNALLAAVDGLRVWFLVDSAAQLALIEDWAARRGSA